MLTTDILRESLVATLEIREKKTLELSFCVNLAFGQFYIAHCALNLHVHHVIE